MNCILSAPVDTSICLHLAGYQHMLINQGGDHHMNERTRHARPESEGRCHCTELRKASRRISQLYDTALAPSGLKTTQRAILAEIGRSAPTTVGALSDALVRDAAALAPPLNPRNP